MVGNRKLGVQWGVRGEGGMGKRFLTAHSSYSRHQIPHNTFLPRTYHYFPHLPVSKKLPEEQIFCGTDPLGAPVRGRIYSIYSNYQTFVELETSLRNFNCQLSSSL